MGENSDLTSGVYTRQGQAGGGNILNYITGDNHEGPQYIDWNLVRQYMSMPLVKAIIAVLLITICVIVILRLYNIKSLRTGKGASNELGNIKRLRDRDAWILKGNKFLAIITKIVENTPFNVPRADKEYLQYNVSRAGLKAPGGYRDLKAEEFNAVVKLAGFALLVISVLVLLVSSSLGIVLIAIVLACTFMLPNLVLRQIVMAKDAEIRKNFSELYLMLHYTLITGGATPIDKVMKSYAKITESPEMVKFVDNCVGHIDTNGEYSATTIIARDYREIAEVGKLMRLIKQMFEGADIEDELIGFREEVMKERKHTIEKAMNKLVLIAEKCSGLVMIILVQAIISAMTIYLPDLGMVTEIFG